MDLETVVKLEARVSGTWEEQDVCSVRSFLEHNPRLSPTDKEKVLQGEDEVYLNLGAGGVVRLVVEEQASTDEGPGPSSPEE
jgi:hypothetical protein